MQQLNILFIRMFMSIHIKSYFYTLSGSSSSNSNVIYLKRSSLHFFTTFPLRVFSRSRNLQFELAPYACSIMYQYEVGNLCSVTSRISPISQQSSCSVVKSMIRPICLITSFNIFCPALILSQLLCSCNTFIRNRTFVHGE